MRLRSRPYQSDRSDLPAMLTLIGRRWLDAAPSPWDYHPGDLLWRRWMHDDAVSRWYERVLLWETDTGLAGFAEYAPKHREIALVTRPDIERDPATIRQMVHDLTPLVRSFDNDRPASPPPVISTLSGSSLESTLRDLGLTLAEPPPFRLNRHSLDETPPPSPPPGWTIRSVQGPADEAGRVAVHQAAFAPSRTTRSAYERMRSQPGYDPELDIVAVDADGAIASYALAWFDPVSRTGLFEPVGCLPAYRRQGLTRAVLQEGLRRLRERGANTAYVVCYVDEPAAVGLYESVGFREIARWNAYAMPADAGAAGTGETSRS